MDSERLTLTVEEAARALGVSRAHLYPLVLSGDVRSVRFGRGRLIPLAALHEFIEANTEGVALARAPGGYA